MEPEGARLASEGSGCGWLGWGCSQELKRAQHPPPWLPTFQHCGWLPWHLPSLLPIAHPRPSCPDSGPGNTHHHWAVPTLPTQLMAETPVTPVWAQSCKESLKTWVSVPALPLCGLGQVTVPL